MPRKLRRSKGVSLRKRKTERREIPDEIRQLIVSSQRSSTTEAAKQNKDPNINISSRTVQKIR
jgi:hypothetical protein